MENFLKFFFKIVISFLNMARKKSFFLKNFEEGFFDQISGPVFGLAAVSNFREKNLNLFFVFFMRKRTTFCAPLVRFRLS